MADLSRIARDLEVWRGRPRVAKAPPVVARVVWRGQLEASLWPKVFPRPVGEKAGLVHASSFRGAFGTIRTLVGHGKVRYQIAAPDMPALRWASLK